MNHVPDFERQLMKLTIARQPFLEAFDLVSNATAAGTKDHPLTKVLLKADSELVLQASNNDITVQATISDATVEQPGKYLLPPGMMHSILREIYGDTITCRMIGEGKMEVSSTRASFNIKVEDPDKFPALELQHKEATWTIPSAALAKSIKRTLFCTDEANSRFALGGILWELSDNQLVTVATDGRRLGKMVAAATCSAKANKEIIVPRPACSLISTLAAWDEQAVISADTYYVLVSAGDIWVRAKLLEGRFPKWRDVIPNRPEAVTLDIPAGVVGSLVRQANIFTTKEEQAVTFALDRSGLRLHSGAKELGTADLSLPLDAQREFPPISLSGRYVLDAISQLDPDKKLEIEIENPDGMAKFSTEDGYEYIVMSMAKD